MDKNNDFINVSVKNLAEKISPALLHEFAKRACCYLDQF